MSLPGEHLLDLHRIGTAPLQVGRGLEGAHAGFEDKVLRIEHDAGEQRRGLALVERVGQHLEVRVAVRRAEERPREDLCQAQRVLRLTTPSP